MMRNWRLVKVIYFLQLGQLYGEKRLINLYSLHPGQSNRYLCGSISVWEQTAVI